MGCFLLARVHRACSVRGQNLEAALCSCLALVNLAARAFIFRISFFTWPQVTDDYNRSLGKFIQWRQNSSFYAVKSVYTVIDKPMHPSQGTMTPPDPIPSPLLPPPGKNL